MNPSLKTETHRSYFTPVEAPASVHEDVGVEADGGGGHEVIHGDGVEGDLLLEPLAHRHAQVPPGLVDPVPPVLRGTPGKRLCVLSQLILLEFKNPPKSCNNIDIVPIEARKTMIILRRIVMKP